MVLSLDEAVTHSFYQKIHNHRHL